MGARCEDGVVIVADTKIVESNGDIRYENKTKCYLQDAVWAASGTREDFGWLTDQLEEKIGKRIDVGRLRPLISERIRERHKQGFLDPFDLMLGIRYPGELKARLFHFNDLGGSDEIYSNYVIGAGEPLGRYFLKKYYVPRMPTYKAMALAFFIIRYIEVEKLDNTVGIGDGTPTVWWVPDLPDDSFKEGKMAHPGIPFQVRQEEEAVIRSIMVQSNDMVDAWREHDSNFFVEGTWK